jgi:hypothetical protein
VEAGGEFVAQGDAESGRIGQLIAGQALAEAVENFGSGVEADIGAQQGGFELGEDRRIDFLAAVEGLVNALGQLLAAAGDRLAEASPPVGLLLLFDFRHRIDLQRIILAEGV